MNPDASLAKQSGLADLARGRKTSKRISFAH
jgi:hypothetical protein